MRRLLTVVCLLLVGCAGPHSTGALWAQQNLEEELVAGRQSATQRAEQARAYELALAEESLAAERVRIAAGLEDCPGSARQPLQLSVGNRARDAIRVRLGDDPQLQAAVAGVALADWWLRRARATAEAHFCDEGRQALSGSQNAAPLPADPLAALGSATVTRAAAGTTVVAEQSATTSQTVSNYALGYVDAVRAPAPLPQYLAAVYGGVVVAADRPPGQSTETPEAIVDRLAPAYPQWEPDALYAAVHAS